ncbi:MAG TPA: hypothetical protein VI035_02005 [Solirubrobacterales bacterium]
MLEDAQGDADDLDRAGRQTGQEAGERLRDRDLPFGRRQAVLTRGECLRDRSQSAQLGGSQPRRAPSGRRRGGAHPSGQ